MLINPISMFSIQAKPKVNKNNSPKLFDNKSSDIFVRSSSNISFKGPEEKSLRTLGNINCPCCGIKMVTNEDLADIEKNPQIKGRSDRAIKYLQPFENSMHSTEKKVFSILKQESLKKPEKTLMELLRSVENIHNQKLKKVQLGIFQEIDNEAKNLSGGSKKLVTKITAEARKAINRKDDERFKRKAFISQINLLKRALPERKIIDKITDIAETLPSSSNNVSAFVVKYASRSPREIASRLVLNSRGTVEHIKPQSQRGESKLSNYLLECADCNNTRGSTPLNEWIETEHPEMVANTQKYMDTVIAKIIHNEVSGFNGYPKDVKETLYKESKGLIDLDISKSPENEFEEPLTNLVDKFKNSKN